MENSQLRPGTLARHFKNKSVPESPGFIKDEAGNLIRQEIKPKRPIEEAKSERGSKYKCTFQLGEVWPRAVEGGSRT